MPEKEDAIQEVREKLVRIEVLLENINTNNNLKTELIEEKIKVANNRITDLENSNTWIWRAIAGALISSVIAFLLK
ncbi:MULTISPECIES: hemolysin XhlA family protein [Terrisporobacter]|uniref:Hemolysin XhlA n=2 Tax=Terrisporobacter TaxID=1505652 RepID=A0A0B3W1G1_9FIRM|nr:MULTISPECIES: hemolysin XhlA family protein [Terrisporobacter]KHS56117.1 hemolysin XhlA [Terrisporobacter othiniensis]MCC3668028.1 hemolysin XhlA family protein [Terrisporobacter mayombei]MCR1821801.1 hemolysin XhlA family protein [Terrisporobacter muris]